MVILLLSAITWKEAVARWGWPPLLGSQWQAVPGELLVGYREEFFSLKWWLSIGLDFPGCHHHWKCSANDWMWCLVIWFRWHIDVWSKVGLDLGDLVQPWWFCDFCLLSLNMETASQRVLAIHPASYPLLRVLGMPKQQHLHSKRDWSLL